MIKDLTLKTKDATGTFPVIGLTVAPGMGIDFTNCEVGETCAIVNGADGKPAAKLSDVQLAEGSALHGHRVPGEGPAGLPLCLQGWIHAARAVRVQGGRGRQSVFRSRP